MRPYVGTKGSMTKCVRTLGPVPASVNPVEGWTYANIPRASGRCNRKGHGLHIISSKLYSAAHHHTGRRSHRESRIVSSLSVRHRTTTGCPLWRPTTDSSPSRLQFCRSRQRHTKMPRLGKVFTIQPFACSVGMRVRPPLSHSPPPRKPGSDFLVGT